MLRVTDSRDVHHVNATEPHHLRIPSRREVLAAFETVVFRLPEQDADDLAEEIETLRSYLATR